jgi:hypothetical protein
MGRRIVTSEFIITMLDFASPNLPSVLSEVTAMLSIFVLHIPAV